MRADAHAIVEIFDVVVGEPDAARRHKAADRRRLVGAVDAIDGITEIERASAERIGFAAGHEAWQVRLALDHFLWREPVRPFLHAADALGARPGETFATDADAITNGLAVAEHQIEVRVRGI